MSSIASSSVFTHNPRLKNLGSFDLLKTVERFQEIETVAEVADMAANVTYASTAAVGSSETINEYVELDTTFYHNCRRVPTVTTVCAAIKHTFGEDDDRSTIAPRRDNDGIWKIETPNIDKYRTITELCFGDEKVAKVAIRKERVTISENGRIQRRFERSDNDVLITLKNADSFPLNRVTDEDILQAIVNMDLGSIKRAPQRQFDRRTKEFSGNKFFVLEGVSAAARLRLPNEFVFNVPNFGNLSMLLTHRHKIRYCGFCGKKHEAICEVKQKVELMKKQRDAMKEEQNFPLKVCGDSTIRYINEISVQGDVEAMSGATIGNLLNSIEVDEENPDSKNIVLVAGINEMKLNVSIPEYIYTLKIIRERVTQLLQQKQVAILAPPRSEPFSSEAKIKEDLYREHLEELAESGVKVWENPVVQYEEDFGDHPSPQQTVVIGKYINEKVERDFGIPMLMESATDEVIALPNKYWNVTTFYKYGCAACSNKNKNKWFNLCDNCKQNASADVDVQNKATDFSKRQLEIEALENPTLQESDGDELRCEICDVCFEDLTEVRRHFTESHPDREMKFKRSHKNDGRSQTDVDDAKKGRRNKSNPLKSL